MDASNESRFAEGSFQQPLKNSAADLREQGMVANARKKKGFAEIAKTIANSKGIPIDRAEAIAAGAKK